MVPQAVLAPKVSFVELCVMVLGMARKKAPAKSRTGRPPKGGEATVHKHSVRLTEADEAVLLALQAREQARANALGLVLSPADTLRIALRREAERQGLIAPMARAS